MNEKHLYGRDSSVALSASAGSGKTYALTTRLLALLLDGLSPSEIVAITFTRLAANEIRKKLFERIVALEKGSPAEVDLFSRVLKKESDEIISSAKRLKRLLVRQFSLLQISTIHSFFTRIIRSFPGKIGVVDFTVIEEAEKKALVRDSVERFYRLLERQNRLLERVYDFFSSYRERKIATAASVRKIHEDVSDAYYLMKEIREIVPGTTDGVEKIFKEKKSALLSPGFERKVLDFNTSIQRMLAFKSRRNLEKFSSDLHSFVTYRNIPNLLKLSPFVQYAQSGLVNYLHYGLRELPDTEEDEFRAAFLDIWRDLQSYTQLEMHYFIHVWFDIYTRIEEYYRELKLSGQCIDYADIERLAGEILAGMDGIESLVYRLDSGMRYILIDEFQDTSEHQWSVLRYIVDGALERGGTLFYVGDVKQSIYRWRGGEPALFRKAQRDLALPEENLPYTYRQNRILLDFVNRVFGTIADRILPAYGYKEQLYPPAGPEAERGFVHIETYDDREELLSGIIGHITGLQKNGVSLNDIAVLCRRNAEIEEVEKILKENSLPFSSVGKTRIMDDYCSMDVLSILRFVVNHREELHLAGILRTPVFRKDYEELAGLEDETGRITLAVLKRKDPDTYERLTELLGVSRYTVPSDFLLNLYRKWNMYSVYPEKRDVLNDFYECACRFMESSQRATIPDFVAYLEENSDTLTLRVGEAHGVTVQTIHASKGLEYHTVIVPYLSKSFGLSLNGSLLYLRDETGAVQHYVLGHRMYVDYFADREALERMKTEAELSYRIDEINALYVALTRACENLVILPLAGKRGKSIGTVLCDAVKSCYSVGALPFACGEVVAGESPEKRAKRFSALSAPLHVGHTAGADERLPAEENNSVSGGEEGYPESAFADSGEGRTASGEAMDGGAHEVSGQWRRASAETEGYRATGPAAEKAGLPMSGYAAGRVGRLRGLIFHRVMEKIERLPVDGNTAEKLIQRALSLEGRRFTSSEKDAAVVGVEERVLEALDDRRLSEYFGAYGHSEVSVFSRSHRNLLARIDRIVIDDDVRIIDFKTNAVEGEDSLNKLVELYSTQVVSYCEALARIYPAKPVRGALYFTEAPFQRRFVKVFDDKAG